MLPPFTPTPWLAGAHAQSIAGFLLRGPPAAVTWSERPTDDGDVVHVAACGPPPAGRRCVVLLPGLEGGTDSSYARHLLRDWSAAGWHARLILPRGTACRPNRLERSGHAADWHDAAVEVTSLRIAGASSVVAVGVSLGGNALMTWRAAGPSVVQADAALAISLVWDLRASAGALDRGFSRAYRKHLLDAMRASLIAKGGLPRAEAERLRSFRDFDDAVTAPRNGFAGVDDYWNRASCGPLLAGITLPTTILMAADDPFNAGPLPPLGPGITLHRTAHGGHVGFIEGWRPRPWLPRAVRALLTC